MKEPTRQDVQASGPTFQTHRRSAGIELEFHAMNGYTYPLCKSYTLSIQIQYSHAVCLKYLTIYMTLIEPLSVQLHISLPFIAH